MSTSNVLSPEAKNLDSALTPFFNVCKNVHKAGSKGSSVSLWLSRVTKLQTAYSKSKRRPEKWNEMFKKFFFDFKEELTKPIFYEDDDLEKVNDTWMKNTEKIEVKVGKSGKANKSGSSGWGPSQMTCTGHVIYFDPTIISASIPISQIYLAAIELATKHTISNIKMFSLPAQVLYHLYDVLSVAISPLEDGYEQIENNVLILKTFLDEILPEDDEDDGVGEGLNGFSKIMGNMMKSAGMDASALGENGMEEAVSSALSGDALGNMGKLMQRIMKDASNAPKESGINGVMDNISKTMQDPEVRQMIDESQKFISEKISTLTGSIPTADDVSSSNELEDGDGDAGDQE